jgi:predicted Rossmann fold flavoprotein
MKKGKWIIIGGGAAGLSAAIGLARSGKKVLLLEQNNRVGKKILATGNGRCNLTNRTVTPEHFHSGDPTFVTQVLAGYGTKTIEKFFSEMGLPLVEGKEGQMFPMSLQASAVVETLEHAARHAGVSIQTEVSVTHIVREDEDFVVRSDDQTWKAKQIVLTAGSPAAPQLGGSMGGLGLAQGLGHTIYPPRPALVQLESNAPWLKRTAGVKLSGIARLYANSELVDERHGDLLFTPYGISGLAILDLSRTASLHLAEEAWCELKLNLLPRFTKEQLTQLLLRRIDAVSDKPIALWLHGILNKKLIPALLEQAKCSAKSESKLSRKSINKLVHAIRNFMLHITDTHGFKHAEVATGGVDVNEIDPATMASRIVPGLYFGGEILDVVGDRGGYNLHWAWVTGIRISRQ